MVLGIHFGSVFALLGCYFGRSVFDPYFLLHWLHFGVIWVSFLVRFWCLLGRRWDLWKLMALLHESILFEVLEGPSSALCRDFFRVLILGVVYVDSYRFCVSFGAPWGRLGGSIW